jgi:hypothetical protein
MQQQEAEKEKKNKLAQIKMHQQHNEVSEN